MSVAKECNTKTRKGFAQSIRREIDEKKKVKKTSPVSASGESLRQKKKKPKSIAK